MPSGDNLSETNDNATLNDLVNDVNAALKDAGFEDDIAASQAGGHLVLSAINADIRSFYVTPGANAAAKLGLDDTEAQNRLDDAGVDTSGITNFLTAGVTLRGRDVPTNPFGRLTDNVSFTLNGQTINIQKTDTDANATINDLIKDINTAINSTSLKGKIVAESDSFHIRFQALDPTIGQISIANLTTGAGSEAEQLGLQNVDSGGTTTSVDLTLVANRLAPVSYGVSTDASFTVNVTDPVNGDKTWSVAIDDLNTITNRSLFDLAADITNALNVGFVDAYDTLTAADNPLVATVQGKQVVIGLKTTDGGADLIGDKAPVSSGVTGFSISVNNADTNSAATQLKLTSDSAGTQTNTADNADFVIYFSDGTSRRISLEETDYHPSLIGSGQKLSDIKTIADLIDAIEKDAKMGGADKVDVYLRADGSGLVLEDVSGGTPSNTTPFKVQAVNGSSAALQLGILGSDTSQFDIGQYDTAAAGNPDGVIEGARIATIDLVDRVFIKKPSSGEILSADLELKTVDLDDTLGTDDDVFAEANLGFVGVKISAESVDQLLFGAHASIPFEQDQVFLSELFSALGDIGNLRTLIGLPTLATTDDFTFNIEVFPDLSSLIDIPSNAQLTFDIQSLGVLEDVTDLDLDPDVDDIRLQLTDPEDISDNLVNITGINIEELANFEVIEFGNIIEALKAISEFLQQFDGLGFLGQDIPVLGVSIDDLLEVADKFTQAVAFNCWRRQSARPLACRTSAIPWIQITPTS
jgi:hypothetical protein